MECGSRKRCLRMSKIDTLLKQGPLLFDGAMHSYQGSQTSKEVLKDYIDAGAMAIKTNTFSCSSSSLPWNEIEQKIEFEIEQAKEAAHEETLIFANIGPCPQEDDAFSIYKKQVDLFLKHGINAFLFETISSLNGIEAISDHIHQIALEAFVLVSFAIHENGISDQGETIQSLYDALAQSSIDAIGMNCRVGPKHMLELLKTLVRCDKPLYISPNAGYPTVLGWNVYYNGSPAYFAKMMKEIRLLGVEMIGGCCGTTPAHIAAMKEAILLLPSYIPYHNPRTIQNDHPRSGKDWRNTIAIELDPPKNDQLDAFMKGVYAFQKEGVDLITLADCPVGRTRADSSLLACKIKKETGIDPLPHITCRDRNLNAIKALLLGLSAQEIHQVLFVTGDPLPSDTIEEVKAVYHFNSRKLMKAVHQMNELSSPMALFGALNINAHNFDQQLVLAKEKEANGAIGFLTQPIHSWEGLQNLKKAKEHLNGVILAGIYPIVSYKNALFLSNEISGMRIDARIVEMYKDKDRKEGEQIAIQISKAIMKEALPYCDGFYLMTPFQRIEMMLPLIQEAKDLLKKTGTN